MNEIIVKAITCPITLDIMSIPVILSDGHTYDKKSAISILNNNKISPITKKRLNDDINNLTINYSVMNMINYYDSNQKKIMIIFKYMKLIKRLILKLANLMKI